MIFKGYKRWVFCNDSWRKKDTDIYFDTDICYDFKWNNRGKKGA